MRLLDRLFPPFREGVREKPRDMLSIAPDRPPWSMTASAALQHLLVALMFVVYSIVAGQAIGLEGDALRDFVAIGILIMGLGTILNGLTTRVSAGHLLITVPDSVTWGVFIIVATQLGVSAAAGGVLILGALIMVLGRFLPLLRVIFPTEVAGVVLVLLALTLGPAGVERASGLAADGAAGVDTRALLIALGTLAVMIGISVWSPPRVRVLALVYGAGTGILLALALGEIDQGHWAKIAAQPFFALPGADYRPPPPTWEFAAILPYLVIALAVNVDTLGLGVTIDRLNDAAWRRPDLPMIGRLMNAVGLCNLLNGLTGTLGSSISAANVGLVHVTGVAARRVAVLAGVLLIPVALLPQLTTFMIQMPQPIVGAILIYTAAFMFVSGTELILSRLLDARRRATVGLGIVAGAASLMVPDIARGVSPTLAIILGSGLMVGTLTAMLLNLVFRIGVGRSAELLLDGPQPQRQATRFLEDQGARWGARREVILRAGIAVGEALEALQRADVINGPARLGVRFDEYWLTLRLVYPGRSIALAVEPADLSALLAGDDEQALDEAMSAVSGRLIRTLADRVESVEVDSQGELRLQFEH
jgi:xanthine/uracil permease